MPNRTKISWVKNKEGLPGEVWNPITGCSKLSEGCQNCYAMQMASTRLRGRCGYDQEHPFALKVHPERLVIPKKRKKPQVYFVNSMSDIFHEDIVYDYPHYIDNILRIMKECPQHLFLILTKRARCLHDFLQDSHDWPTNLWLGISVENQKRYDERMPYLAEAKEKIPGINTFVSLEPLIGPINIDHPYGYTDKTGEVKYTQNWAFIDWVIVGGETGRDARPMHPEWVREIRDYCMCRHVYFYFKSWGHWIQRLHYNDFKGKPNKIMWILLDYDGKYRKVDPTETLIISDRQSLMFRSKSQYVSQFGDSKNEIPWLAR